MTPRLNPPLPTIALLATALLLPSPANAQSPSSPAPTPAPTSEPASEPEDLSEPLGRRVVELDSGDFLRARTRREADGTWQRFSDGAWRDLPGVRRASLERTLISQADDLARGVKQDPVRRVALADWMARQGLATEALRELDRVLREDPTQADALKLLADPPRGLDLLARQQSAQGLFQTAVGAPPALRELALGRLAEVEASAVLYERMRASIASSSARTRTTAARGLGRFFPGESLKELLVRSVLDGSEDVRQQAAAALGSAEDPAVILPLVRALASENTKVRSHAALALGNAGYPAAVPPLMAMVSMPQSRGGSGSSAPAANIFVGRQRAFVQDFDVEVASGAAVADPTINVLTEGSVLDARVQGVASYSAGAVGRSYRKALGQLTGANPGSSDRAWIKWWEANQGDWR